MLFVLVCVSKQCPPRKRWWLRWVLCVCKQDKDWIAFATGFGLRRSRNTPMLVHNTWGGSFCQRNRDLLYILQRFFRCIAKFGPSRRTNNFIYCEWFLNKPAQVLPDKIVSGSDIALWMRILLHFALLLKLLGSASAASGVWDTARSNCSWMTQHRSKARNHFQVAWTITCSLNREVDIGWMKYLSVPANDMSNCLRPRQHMTKDVVASLK